MLDPEHIEQVRDAARGDELAQHVLWDCAGSWFTRSTDQKTLNRISHNLAGEACTPGHNGTVEALAFPPIGILAGCMHGDFECARRSLADLISSHQQPLARLG